MIFSFVQLTTTLLRTTKLGLSLSLENSKKICYNIYIEKQKERKIKIMKKVEQMTLDEMLNAGMSVEQIDAAIK